MKGTNRKNFGKSGRSGAVLTLAGLFIMTMALVFGFTACETDEDEGDLGASEFQGTYTAMYDTTTLTIGADSVTPSGGTAITGISTGGGGSESGQTSSGVSARYSWAYVYVDGAKVGIVCVQTVGSTTSGYLGLGSAGADYVKTALTTYGVTASVSDMGSAGSLDGLYTKN